MSRARLGLLAFVLLGFFASNACAAGTASRAWVSGHGTDAAGCGAPTAPCRSLQYAEDNIIANGGEIDILDPAGYGAVIISKALSIVNDGVGTAGVQQPDMNGTAIVIDVGSSDAVTLRGLSIDGLGAAGDGIAELEAGKLTIDHCVIRHFTHDGVLVQQEAGLLTLTVIGVTSADNASNGFDITPSTSGATYAVIDHSYAVNNGANGVVAWGLHTGANDRVWVTVANGDFSNNGNAGVYAKGSGNDNTQVMVRNNVADYDQYGYYIDAGALMIFSGNEGLNNLTDSVFLNTGGDGVTLKDNAFDAINTPLTVEYLQ